MSDNQVPEASEPLTFDLLDDILLAHERRRPVGLRAVPAASLGAVVEMMKFEEEHKGGLVYEPSEETDAIRRCFTTRRPVYLNGESAGFVPARRELYQNSDAHWDAFQFAMHKAIVAAGLLHHLTDDEARTLLRLARVALKPDGRFVSIDPAWADGQNPVAQFLISIDRGVHVRDAAGYTSLARHEFSHVSGRVRHRAWLPYTHWIMECGTGGLGD